ncbi:hypothetical protein CL655_03435 [bacterium]|nr:hypothetical protein [bacterium]
MMFLRRLLHRFRKQARVRTIRHTFSFATLAALSLVATVLLTDTTSYIRLEAPERSVAAGDSFSVYVYAGAHRSVNAVDIAVSFPSNQVEVTGIDTGESVISLWTQDPYVEGSQVILRGGTFRKGFVGEHQVARINFKANTGGRAEFSVSETTLLAGDGNGSEVDEIADTPILVVGVSEDGILSGDVAISFITDIDGDGNVSLADVNEFMRAWRNRQWLYDFNQDRRMNFTDFAIILADSFFN